MAGAPNARFASQPDAAPTNVRYQVVAWLTLAAAIAYLTRNAVSVAESTIREDLAIRAQAAARVENHTHRAGSLDVSDRESGVVGFDRLRAHDHSIH